MQYLVPGQGWVSESATADFGLPIGWLSETEATGGSAVLAPDTGTSVIQGLIPVVAISGFTAVVGSGSIVAFGLVPTISISSIQIISVDVGTVAAAGLVPTKIISNLDQTPALIFSRALSGIGWVVETTQNELGMPHGWISEAAVSNFGVGADIAGEVAAPTVVLAATATQVAPPESLNAVVLALPSTAGWVSETSNIDRGIPGPGWLVEVVEFVGAMAEVAAAVPAPSVAVTVSAFPVAAIASSVPAPSVAMTGEMLAWEIGQIFDNVPAPSVSIAAQTIETVQASIAAVPTPIASVSAKAFLMGALEGVVDAPSVYINAFALEEVPFADIVGEVEAPSVSMDATAYAGGDVASVVPAPEVEMVASSYSGAPAPDLVAQAVWDMTLEGAYTSSDLLRLISAVTAGKTSINVAGDQATVTFRNVSDNVDAAQAQVDGSERIDMTVVPQGPVGGSYDPLVLSYAQAVWASVLEGAYSGSDFLRMIAAVMSGKTSITDLGNGRALVTFRNVTDSGDMVVAEMNESERTDVEVTP